MALMDSSLSEIFFGGRHIIVEGDTEYVAFLRAVAQDPDRFGEINVIRARGKLIIPALIKMLTHFKVSFGVLHDSDLPTTGADKTNPAWTANETICNAIAQARTQGVEVAHRVSVPDFEVEHTQTSVSKDKPWRMYKRMTEEQAVMESISKILHELVTGLGGDKRLVSEPLEWIKEQVIPYGLPATSGSVA